MSIIISVAIPEGIVIVADSRQSYINARQEVQTVSASIGKVYLVQDRGCPF